MIGWLSGTVREVSEDRAIIETGGVGYEVFATPNTLAGMQSTHDKVEIFIHTHVREDALILFGFATRFEREVFLLLNSVSGIGPKSALAILSALPTDRLVDAIRTANMGALQAVHGIGKKTAERVVVELRDRLRKLPMPTDGKAYTPEAAGAGSDLVSALLNLGYKRPDAEAALAQIDLSKSAPFDTILKQALKYLAKS